MERIPTIIPGCFEIKPRVFADDRGTFIKTFHRDTFQQWGLAHDFAEQFYSVSRQNVLRGMHFQLPPQDHAKLVTCTAGRALDAVIDLRTNSPTYRQYLTLTLDARLGNMIYIPPGLAHGFLTLSESATLLYNATTAHSPVHDAGIRWDSAGIPWPQSNPIVSPRDAAFKTLANFDSPFRI